MYFDTLYGYAFYIKQYYIMYCYILALQHIVGIIPHQSLATGVQYAVSTKAAEANEPHRYDEIRDEPGVSNM